MTQSSLCPTSSWSKHRNTDWEGPFVDPKLLRLPYCPFKMVGPIWNPTLRCCLLYFTTISRDNLQIGLWWLSTARQSLLNMQRSESQGRVTPHLYCKAFLQHIIHPLTHTHTLKNSTGSNDIKNLYPNIIEKQCYVLYTFMVFKLLVCLICSIYFLLLSLANNMRYLSLKTNKNVHWEGCFGFPHNSEFLSLMQHDAITNQGLLIKCPCFLISIKALQRRNKCMVEFHEKLLQQ